MKKFPASIEERVTTIREFERLAQGTRTPGGEPAFEWLSAGAEHERTLRRNLLAFDEISLRPRILRNVSRIETTASFLGLAPLPIPVITAPLGQLTQFSADGEIDVARGVQLSNSIFCVSTQSRIAIEEIRQCAPSVRMIWQIYFYGDRFWVSDQLQRAFEAGVEAICVCADAPMRPIRYRDRELRYDARLVGRRTNPVPPAPEFNRTITWDDIDWLRSKVSLPLILKGVLDTEDAVLAKGAGVDCIWISNHGGRQLDSGLATLDVVSAIRRAVGPAYPLIIDGGVRSGTDVVKALALGANLVALGRPIVHGLIVGGDRGVHHLFNLLQEELISAMAHLGLTSIQEIDERAIIRRFNNQSISAVFNI